MTQQINLYNPIFLKQEKYFSARTMAQALALLLLGLVALYGYAFLQTVSAQYAAETSAQLEQYVLLSAKLSPQAQSKALEAEVARLEAEMKARQETLAALGSGVLGNTAGISEFLAAFGRRSMDGVWLTAFDIGEGGNDLNLTGRVLHADLVTAYLRALSEEPVMRGRRVTQMKLLARTEPAAGEPVKKAEGFVEFHITAPLRLGSPDGVGR